MTDNQLLTLLVAGFSAELATRAPYPVAVKQSFGSRQQGAKSGPVLYLFKVGDKRVGSLQRKDTLNKTTNPWTFDHLESQWYETTFQAMALVPQDPAQPNSLTTSDIVNVGADIIQSDSMMARLRAQRVGVLRVSEVRNPYFVDDAERNEAEPSFDFVLTHKRETINGVPVVVTVEYNFARV